MEIGRCSTVHDLKKTNILERPWTVSKNRQITTNATTRRVK